MKKHFICIVCEEALPASQLSSTSLDRSGCETRLEAINVIEEPICRLCEEEEEATLEDIADLDGEDLGRNEKEAWEFSGVRLDPGRLSAYLQSN